jgi:hypothetical protein
MKTRESAGEHMRLLTGTVYRTDGVHGMYFFDLQNSSVPPPLKYRARIAGRKGQAVIIYKKSGTPHCFPVF